MSSYVVVDQGVTPLGTRWSVGTADGHRLLVKVGGSAAGFEGAERERFAEAVARALAPGQVPGEQEAP